MGNPGYALGHSDREITRLQAQARLLAPITQQFLREAGIAPGMRVLDIGSGAGYVAFLAAELVGPCGAVIGSDTEGYGERALAIAGIRRSRRPGRIDSPKKDSLVAGARCTPFRGPPNRHG